MNVHDSLKAARWLTCMKRNKQWACSTFQKNFYCFCLKGQSFYDFINFISSTSITNRNLIIAMNYFVLSRFYFSPWLRSKTNSQQLGSVSGGSRVGVLKHIEALIHRYYYSFNIQLSNNHSRLISVKVAIFRHSSATCRKHHTRYPIGSTPLNHAKVL